MSNTATAPAPFNTAQLEIMQLFAEGVNRQRFNKLVKEINITEPIELLLSQL